MKRIMIFLALLCLCIISCSGKPKPVQNVNDRFAIIEKTMAKQSITIDSLTVRIDLLDSAIVSCEENVDKQEKEIAQLKSTKDKRTLLGFIVIILLGIVVILVLQIRFWRKTFTKKEGDSLHNEFISLKNTCDKLKEELQLVKRNPSRKNEKLDGQIADLLQRMFELEKTMTTVRGNTENKPDEILRPVYRRNGYFGMVRGDRLFDRFYESRQDECLFKVSLDSTGKEASYEPINWQRIQSIDGLERAIRYQTDEASQSEATSYVVINKGKAEYNDGFWYIVEPAIIKLRK